MAKQRGSSSPFARKVCSARRLCEALGRPSGLTSPGSLVTYSMKPAARSARLGFGNSQEGTGSARWVNGSPGST